MDGDIDEAITRDAIVLFTVWANKKIINTGDILPSQRITKWRPTKNIAIITTKVDLRKILVNLNTSVPMCFSVLFQDRNVLRLKLNTIPDANLSFTSV